MKSKKYIILILVLLAAVAALAGLFYWQSRQPNEPTNQNPVTQKEPAGLPSQEQEIATTTPLFEIKGEISRGNQNKKQIIFTFDAGAGINSVQKILEVAQKHNLTLTFFSTGKFAQNYPEIIKQISTAGHEIFNHTYDHPHLPQLTNDQIKEELEKTDQILSGLTNKTTKPYFRPPYGDRNAHVLEVATQNGYQSVYWTLDAWDWMTDKTAEEVKQRIELNLKPGAIILMHVGDDITGQILDEVFTYIENQGYKIVNLSEGIK